jgi:GNAT superfamily N-acetyltransferase
MMVTTPEAPVAGAGQANRGRARSGVVSMTERYFGFDWATVLPWSFDEVSVELSTPDEMLSFLAARGDDLFASPNQNFLNEPMTEAKRRFCAEMDALALRKDGRTVGYFLGHPSDWSTYYGRSFSFLPEMRKSGIGMEFSRRILQTIAERTEARRFEVDSSVANPAMPRILIGLGFVPAMTLTTERWGLMTRFVKYLDPEARKVFARQFVNVPDLGQEVRGERT